MLQQNAVVRARTDADLEAMIAVRRQVTPEARPTVANLRHNLDTNPSLAYLVGRAGTRPVACGFVEATPAEFAAGDIAVVPAERGRGVGSTMLAAASEWARELGKTSLQGEVRESDEQSRSFLERRGFIRVGGERAVSLDLAAAPAPAAAPVRVVSVAERPELIAGMYEVALEAEPDIPGNPGVRTFEEWRAEEIDKPSRRPELCFAALAGEEVVGYAGLHVFGSRTEAHHGLTAVKRAWRRRGVATALKTAQIEAARRAGFERLVTGSEERNLPMRRLNEKLGYKPDPARSTVVMRGPLTRV